MALTPFGWLYLTALLGVLAFRRRWLPFFVPLAAMLHAPAVAVVGTGFGVTPWQATCLALAAALVPAAPSLLGRLRELDRTVLRLLLGWTVLTALCVVSAFALPLVFEGLLTYDNQQIENLAAGPKPLELRLGNAAQAANAVLMWIALAYGALVRPGSASLRALMAGFATAAVLSLLLSLLQRGLLLAGIDPFAWASHSLNPGYGHVLGYLYAQDGVRVGWPFSEPSYASVWFAALSVAGLTAWLWRGSRLGLVLLACGACGLLNSFSGTGIAAAFLCGTALWMHAAICARRAARDRAVMRRTFQLAAVSIGAGCVIALASTRVQLTHERWGTLSVPVAVVEFMKQKIYDHRIEAPSRWDSNVRALQVVAETHGLGAGLGSNRASSYAVNMLSNLGVLPSLLFALLVAALFRALWRSGADARSKTILAAGAACTLAGITLGIPDLMWPVWWLYLIAAFWALCWSPGAPARGGAAADG